MTRKELQKPDLELEKLDLEIKNLRKKNTWEGVAPVISVITVLLTVIGGLFAFYSWLNEQELQRKAQEQERAARYQTQLTSDLSELSRFTQDKSITLSRVSFLLNDIAKVIAIASKDALISAQFQDSERTVTTTLIEQVRHDTNFIESSRDVSYVRNIAKLWKDYKEYVKQDDQLDVLEGIIYQHVRAVRDLHDKHKEYIDKLKFDVRAGQFNPDQKAEQTEGEEALFQHYTQLLEGFKVHLSFLPDNPKANGIKQRQIWAFGEAVCKESVAKFYVGAKDFVATPCMPKGS